MTGSPEYRLSTLPGTVALALLVSCCLAVALAAGPASAAVEDADPAPATDRSPDRAPNLTLYRAGNGSFDDAADVEAAIRDGSLDAAGAIAVGETLVVVIDSPRLATAMDARNRSATDRFLGVLDGEADLRLLETRPPPQSTRMFATVGPENVTAYRNGTTTYVRLETGNLRFRRPVNDTEARPVDGFYDDRVAVSFGFGLPAPREVPRRADLSGPTFELFNGRYLTETPSPTPAPAATTEARTPTPASTPPATESSPRTPTPVTASPPSTADADSQSTDSPTASQSAADASGPGFTAVSLITALVALLAARARRA